MLAWPIASPSRSVRAARAATVTPLPEQRDRQLPARLLSEQVVNALGRDADDRWIGERVEREQGRSERGRVARGPDGGLVGREFGERRVARGQLPHRGEKEQPVGECPHHQQPKWVAPAHVVILVRDHRGPLGARQQRQSAGRQIDPRQQQAGAERARTGVIERPDCASLPDGRHVPQPAQRVAAGSDLAHPGAQRERERSERERRDRGDEH